MSKTERFVRFGVAVVAFTAALTGCSTGACPAIGYLSTISVKTTGDFATLEACVAGDCVNSADAPSDVGLFGVTSDGDGSWMIGSFPGGPDKITLRTRDEAGATISEAVFDLKWTRTGGSEECGGPVKTPAIEFDS